MTTVMVITVARDGGTADPATSPATGACLVRCSVLSLFTESSTSFGRVICVLRGTAQERHLPAAGRRDAPGPRPAGQLNGYLRQCASSVVARRYVLALAVLVPDQAAFPDTARLLPVIVPTPAHAWRLAGLLNSSSSAPWRTTAYTAPAQAR